MTISMTIGINTEALTTGPIRCDQDKKRTDEK